MSKKQSSRHSKPQKLFYTEAFKQKIVNEVLSGKLNKRQASLIYGIKGNATILYWINQSQGLKGFEKKAAPIANFAEMRKNIQDKKLEEENKELKELLRVAELRADLWQHAIEVAEKKFGIDILKKYGAQLSKASNNKEEKKK
ncbi:MAG: transposase [Bacteroidota bacterium]|jgi:transposase-like protein|nr:transposase [Bacteroidota bacterium]